MSEQSAIIPKKNPTVEVGKMVQGFLERGTIHLPGDYSAPNALKSAWLILQETVDKDKRPVLTHCSEASIVNALLDMVVQALNPAKKQCYFIDRGGILTLQRSYFGDIALAQRVRPGIEPYHEVVYIGDDFQYEIIRGRKCVLSHKQKLEDQDNTKIRAAYCGFIVEETGEDLGSVIMTIDQIHKSWEMSKTYNPDGGKATPHNNFADQMCIRTVIRRRCKPVIASSTDKMLIESIARQESESVEADMAEEVAALGNASLIDVAPAELPTAPAVTAAEAPKAPANQSEEANF